MYKDSRIPIDNVAVDDIPAYSAVELWFVCVVLSQRKSED
jgi:hypothetical protein